MAPSAVYDVRMEIRPYVEADEAAVIALWNEAGLVRPWNDPRKDIARKLRVQRDMFLVAEHDGAIVGVVMGGYDGHRGWVNYLAVATSHRRRGLGATLMREIEARLRALGCPKINLQVRRSNHDVLAFYAALGFAEDDAVSLGLRLERDD
jgi:ribosomal protein S18 acetylase RimI-like enzyme